MQKSLHPSPGTASVPGGDSLWLSNLPAESTVTFEAGYWVVYLETEDWSEDCTIRIGKYNGSFTRFNPISTQQTWADGIFTLKYFTGDESVGPGEYLALKITNSNDSQDIIIGDSYLAAPASTPSFPVPEASALILLALGISGLFAFVGVKRKRA